MTTYDWNKEIITNKLSTQEINTLVNQITYQYAKDLIANHDYETKLENYREISKLPVLQEMLNPIVSFILTDTYTKLKPIDLLNKIKNKYKITESNIEFEQMNNFSQIFTNIAHDYVELF